MRTILYIVVFKFFLIGGFAQNPAKIIEFKNGKCQQVFYTADTKWNLSLLTNRDLELKFTYETSCSLTFNPKLIKVNSDSLILEFKPLNRADFQDDCLCYYDFLIKISNVKKIPGVVVIDGKYHHDFFGFIYLDFFNQVKNKKFENNSENIDYLQLTGLVGKKISNNTVKTMLNNLGNDYIFNEYWDESNYSFVADHIYIFFKNNTVNRVRVDSLFKGSLPLNLSLNSNIVDVKKKIGEPDEFSTVETVFLKENGEKVKLRVGLNCYYKRYNLYLRIDKEGLIMSGCFGEKESF